MIFVLRVKKYFPSYWEASYHPVKKTPRVSVSVSEQGAPRFQGTLRRASEAAPVAAAQASW